MAPYLQLSVQTLFSSEVHTTLPTDRRLTYSSYVSGTVGDKVKNCQESHPISPSSHWDANFISHPFYLGCIMIFLNLYHKRNFLYSPTMCSELTSIKSISLILVIGLWTEHHHYDSWAYWGSQRLTYLPRVAPQGSSTGGFKLGLVSLQSLLHKKRLSCFYATLLLIKHLLSAPPVK